MPHKTLTINKVYLSKSKAADPDKIISAKKISQKLYGNDIEFIEFKGGPYDRSIIDPADTIIVVLPSPIHKESNTSLLINSMGRGNYSEAIHALGQGQPVIFILHEKKSDLLDYDNLGILAFDPTEHTIEEIPEGNPNKNWQKAYARIFFKDYTTINMMKKSSYPNDTKTIL